MDFYTYSNIGDRQVNEDFYGVSTFNGTYCFVVADGLGGHGGGDVASKYAVSEISRVFMEKGYSASFFREAFESAQQKIISVQEETGFINQMKTTLVVVVMDKDYVYCAHVGDSRAYFFKNNKYMLHSIDHSVPQMLQKSGEIKEEDIRFHPDRNRLTRVMGNIGESPDFSEWKKIKRRGLQSFLLCTDGFWELIDEENMSACLKESAGAEEWVNRMSEIIKRNGENKVMDNYTCIAIKTSQKRFLGGLL